jgi:hypothetical protein
MKEVKKEEEVSVKLELLQEIVDYLQMQPYHQVHELIRKLIIATHKE